MNLNLLHHHASAAASTPRFLPFAIARLPQPPPPRLHPPVSLPPNPPSYLPNSSPPPLPVLPNDLGLTSTSLLSTPAHTAWIAIGFSSIGAIIFKAAASVDSIECAISSVLAAAAANVLADLSTGIYHWAVDNYGDASTPIFGSQIDAFQGHHRRPWTITKRHFANNIHALARPASFTILPFLLLPSNAVFDSFLGFFLAFVVLSQQFHSWAHCKKKELPAIVLKLQDAGILVSRKMHGSHHRSPYDINYCIVNGMWNPLLDRTNFFGKLESFIFARWGVKPRSWGETAPEWLQEGSYFADGTDSDSHSSQ